MLACKLTVFEGLFLSSTHCLILYVQRQVAYEVVAACVEGAIDEVLL
jgi:hypothetical protein